MNHRRPYSTVREATTELAIRTAPRHLALVECPTCQGVGEVAVSGTYGATVSPEMLETIPCPWCEGQGEVTQTALDAFQAHLEGVLDAFQSTTITAPPF